MTAGSPRTFLSIWITCQPSSRMRAATALRPRLPVAPVTSTRFLFIPLGAPRHPDPVACTRLYHLRPRGKGAKGPCGQGRLKRSPNPVGEGTINATARYENQDDAWSCRSCGMAAWHALKVRSAPASSQETRKGSEAMDRETGEKWGSGSTNEQQAGQPTGRPD